MMQFASIWGQRRGLRVAYLVLCVEIVSSVVTPTPKSTRIALHYDEDPAATPERTQTWKGNGGVDEDRTTAL